jgi:hypothetical protein
MENGIRDSSGRNETILSRHKTEENTSMFKVTGLRSIYSSSMLMCLKPILCFFCFFHIMYLSFPLPRYYFYPQNSFVSNSAQGSPLIVSYFCFILTTFRFDPVTTITRIQPNNRLNHNYHLLWVTQ